MSSKNTILHLSLIDGIGPVMISKIIQACNGTDIDSVYRYSVNDFRSQFGMSEKLGQAVYNGLADKKLLENQLLLIERSKCHWTVLGSDSYPSLLATIYAPSAVLYWMGAEKIGNDNAISIVGSRDADQYARSVIEQLVPSFVAHNQVIISGGALGADAIAHQQAILADGITYAILGSGLLHWYPSSNKKLFESILNSSGALISIFPLSTQPSAGNFPARNRVIAGMSKACVVVQAAEKSGALITAKHALEQGREVGAVPGNITHRLSAGCNWLIKQGAIPVTSADDIFDALGMQIVASKEVVIKKNNQSPDLLQQKISDMPISIDVSSNPGKKILAFCYTPRTYDEVIEYMNLDAIELNTILFDLQLQGTIEQTISGQFKTIFL